MTLIAAAGLLFLFLLLLPIGLALFWYARNKNSKNSVLPIRQDRTRDPRYFAHAFQKLFLEAWEQSDGKTLTLHKYPETFLHSDDFTNKTFPLDCDQLVVAQEKNLCTPPNVSFQKEVYARNSAFIGPGSTIRAIHAEKNLDLGDETQVVRWADAEGTVNAGAGCDLGMSLTSGQGIRVGRNCIFRRMYAPVIEVGIPEDHPLSSHIFLETISTGENHIHKRRIKQSHMEQDGILHKSVLSAGKLWVDENLIILGSLRAQSGVKIGRNSVICGNIFCDGDVYLQRNCRILGNIFSQGDVYCEAGTEIGVAGQIRSVIARQHITLEDGCRVYGYLSCEDYGICDPRSRRSRNKEEADHYTPLTAAHNALSRRFTGIAVALIFVAAVITVTLMATALSNRLNTLAEPDEPVSEEILYENQGLEPGIQLAAQPSLITDSQVEFPDRVLLRCGWDQGQEYKLTRNLNELLEAITEKDSSVSLYCMSAPLRIGFEEAFPGTQEFKDIAAQEKQKLQNLEAGLTQDLTPVCTFLPLMDTLSQHQEEYLFFRGAPTWTARGSYYASQVFLEAADLPTFPIDSFYETARTKSSCVLTHATGDPPADRRYVYLYEDYNPLLENLTLDTREPMYSSIRSSYSAFMGGSYGVGVMEGLGENNRVLMVIGFKNAQVLTPWMVSSFQKIIYVNTDIFNVETESLAELFDRYQITHCLIVHDADTLETEYLSHKYHQLAKQLSGPSDEKEN